jgi:uncharacterized protein
VGLGFRFHQYIPIVEMDQRGDPLPFTIGGPQWGEFLCAIFDRWARDDLHRVSVRQFDAILAYLVDGSRPVCTMQDSCCQYLVVEHNGDVYPCDFYVEPGLRLGNIMESGWDELLQSPGYLAFGKRKAAPAACLECVYLELCRGDCPRNRLTGTAPQGRPSWLCEGWKMFYEHALPRLRKLARTVLRGEAMSL